MSEMSSMRTVDVRISVLRSLCRQTDKTATIMIRYSRALISLMCRMKKLQRCDRYNKISPRFHDKTFKNVDRLKRATKARKTQACEFSAQVFIMQLHFKAAAMCTAYHSVIERRMTCLSHLLLHSEDKS